MRIVLEREETLIKQISTRGEETVYSDKGFKDGKAGLNPSNGMKDFRGQVYLDSEGKVTGGWDHHFLGWFKATVRGLRITVSSRTSRMP